MKHITKRLISFAFALIMIMSLAAPAFAAGRIYPTEGNITARMLAKKNGMVWVEIAYGNKNFTINRSDVKVYPGTSGAEFVSFKRLKYENGSITSWYNDHKECWEDSNFTSRSYTYTVGLRLQQAGSARIKYKIGSKQYFISVKAMAYNSPVKSATLSGFRGGKNIADKNAADKNIRLTSNIKNATFRLSAESGWKLQSMMVYDLTTRSQQIFYPKDNAGSGYLRWGRMYMSHKYTMTGEFENKDTEEIITVHYYVNQ